MSNSEIAGGCLAILMIGGHIASALGSGYYAWQWIEPESFFGAIKFLIAWGILGYIADLILMAIIAGVAHLFGENL
ncbi:MAG: hypothetical protein ACOYPR_02135 [Saprospiraceae bacterium]